MSFLEDILAEKQKEIELIKPLLNDNQYKDCSTSFKKRISKDRILISEIKRGSPSKGLFAGDLDIVKTAKQYEKSGADIISVLTDKKFFYGGFEILRQVRENTNLPILCKDFIIDNSQIRYAKQNGADLILLIGAALTPEKAEKLIEFAHSINLEVLFEIHNLDEYNMFKHLDFDLLGINNRNLKTFKTDLRVTIDIMNSGNITTPVISESGIKNIEDIELLISTGVNGFLIGESLIKSKDKSGFIKKIKEF